MDVNTYILAKEGKALVIDPGFNGQKVIEHCSNHQLKIEKIVLTHGHYDHIRDLKLLLNEKVDVYIHEAELDFLYKPNLNLSNFFKDDFILYNITVSNNAILTLQGDIFLNDDVKITVNHGSTLYLKGAHLQSYCGNNWEGIIVKGNKDSSLGPTGNAMLTASGAILEDAECAILLGLTNLMCHYDRLF